MEYKDSSFYNELSQAIDYDKVLKQIASFASFSCSKQAIQEALPLKNLIEIQRLLKLSKEAMELERQGSLLNFAGVSDISLSLQKATKQMTLNGQELYAIVLFLHACRNVAQTLDKTEAQSMKEIAQSMDFCGSLVRFIEEKIDLSGNVKDNASPFLKQAHKELLQARSSLNQRSKIFLKKHNSQLMENMTTTIQGRLCVLVRAQDKHAFGGMVHGQSQSGLAYYIEPSAFVEANNAIQSLLSDIESEKQRIVKECTKQVAKNTTALLSNLDSMTQLDVAYAKGCWAYKKDGCIPLLQTKDHAFSFEHACHPLIDAKKVVANTYRCSAKQACLMISGPNMGGKSVTLKTIGLFMLLAHAGFPVLCHSAHVPYYDSFYFDIGDQQSIENNLSTFSSHISKIARITSLSTSNSFILVDELGNGTDPSEGESLAIAILEALIQKGCTIVTSTHFNQVKSFGKTHPNVLVSSVEFDRETLKPTYRYIEGVSGSSYAFYIAAQYHLNPAILEKAEAIKAQNTKDVDLQLEKLEKMQNEVRQEKEKFNQLIANAHDLQRQAEADREKMDKKKAKLEEEYREQLQAMLDEKQAEAKAIIRSLRQEKSGPVHKQTELLHSLNTMNPSAPVSQKAEPLKVGDYVQIKDVNSHGEIVELRKKEATILSNGMKMKIKTNRLTKIKRPNVPLPTIKQHTADKVFKKVPTEINVIGMRVEEGLDAVDHFLDQAVAHRLKQVRIIHGMGTGKLRSAIWQYLDKHPNVKSKVSGGPSDGGLGATIVLLK